MSNENFSIHGYNLVTLLKRLETATSRLEDVTIFQQGVAERGTSQVSAAGAPSASAIPPAPVAKAVTAPPPAPVASAVEELPRSIQEFDDFLADYVDPYVANSKKVDPIVLEQAELFKTALLEERNFLLAASKSKEVELTDPIFQEALAPINRPIIQIGELKDNNRKSKFYNNLNTVAEGVPALGWICTKRPSSFIPDFKDSAQFWSNRILKENKDTDPDQVAWAKSFIAIFDPLNDYAKNFHNAGPTWNPQGGSLRDNLKATPSSSTAKTAAGAPPPPPPPPPPSSVFEVKAEPAHADPTAGSLNAVFSELNKGENITKGLKKVDRSQQTHKNPSLRKSSSVSSKKGHPVPPKKPSSLSGQSTKKPEQKELIDSKWIISNIVNSKDMIEIDGEMHQSVFISNCDSAVIQIKGKVNAISINACNKVGVVIDKAISGVDVIKSTKLELQVIDSVPVISIDQSDSCSLYFSESSLGTEIYTSSTTSLNVNIPDGDDLKELAAPEQFRHAIKSGKLVTTVVEHAG